MGEERTEAVLLLIMAILETVLIARICSKVRYERAHKARCNKVSAVVKSVTRERVSSRYIKYSFVVNADNGCIYNIRSCSNAAFFIQEGSRVDILVPEGAYGKTEKDEYYEQICMGGEDAVRSLSTEEKIRLEQYLDRRQKSTDPFIQASLACDGGGLKGEILPMCIIAAVIAVFLAAGAAHIFGLIS